MTNEERNTALYQKMFAEQESFRDWLKGQPPEEILNHAYEYTIREDILLSLEYHNLSDAQIDTLMKSSSPLTDVFRDFEKLETGHMDTVWDCLENRADSILEDQRRAPRETPVYPYPASYAQEHGELEQYRASNRANAACKKAIEAAIREHYDGNSLVSQAAAQVVEAFGLDRTLYVLANTVQQRSCFRHCLQLFPNRGFGRLLLLLTIFPPDGAEKQIGKSRMAVEKCPSTAMLSSWNCRS